jgi:hypothetical protein
MGKGNKSDLVFSSYSEKIAGRVKDKMMNFEVQSFCNDCPKMMPLEVGGKRSNAKLGS